MAAPKLKPSTSGPVVTMRNKGQVTIPAELRDKHGWKEGVRFTVVETDRGLTLEPVRDIMQLAGIFKQYARPEHWTMTAEEILESDRRALQEAMDEDLMAELE